jgi:hypothetical protein
MSHAVDKEGIDEALYRPPGKLLGITPPPVSPRPLSLDAQTPALPR